MEKFWREIKYKWNNAEKSTKIIVAIVLACIIIDFVSKTVSGGKNYFSNIGNTIIYIIILLFSLSLHEISHAAAAYLCGDNTAKEGGRISLNIFKHLDPIGTLVPVLLIFTGAPFVIGWAKPVPINYMRLKNGRIGEFIVSVAGVFANFMLAILGVVLLKVLLYSRTITQFWAANILKAIFLNIVLGVFNLIPIPPLDGSRVVAAFMPEDHRAGWFRMDRIGLLIIILLSWTNILTKIIDPIIVFIFNSLMHIASL